MFVDTHCHISYEDYDNIDELIMNIKNSKVEKIIVNGTDMKSNLFVLELVRKYDIVYGALGFHPTELDDFSYDYLDWLDKNIDNDKIVALGEIGLDYHYENTDKEKQIDVLKRQLDIAVKHNKPIIFHCRDAIGDTYNILKKYNLKVRSKSFFQQLYKKEGWKSPIKHKCFDNKKDNHPLRDPMPRRGMLIMTDGTPHDWFGNGIKFSLHMTLDDATGEILSGWFTPTETQLGYCYAFKIMFIKYGIPQVIYGDRTSILWNQIDGELTQVGRMLEELGIELIYANSSEAKGKIEKMNYTIQNRLLNDIKRFNIKTYKELNEWFNNSYIEYINKKFSYKPKEEETEFIPLGNTDLTKIMCIKEERIVLNGNMISYKNNYYIPITDEGCDYIFYKGTKVEIWQDVFDIELIRICKDKKIYNTRKIEGHRKDPIKREQKRIQDQKELEKLFRERDERLKARAKRS